MIRLFVTGIQETGEPTGWIQQDMAAKQEQRLACCHFVWNQNE